jgi:hypothetical protein
VIAPIYDINKKYVAVLKGASAVLVTHRELRGHTVSKAPNKKRKKFNDKYQASRTTEGYKTNRSIKTWSTYFLLKSLTTSGLLMQWTKQKDYLLSYCKITENCFRARLAEMQTLGLITISKNRSITLTSFTQAAQILGIDYTGTIKIEYNEKVEGQQIFQYYLVMDEVRCNQQQQLDALNYKVNKNPQLKEILHSVMLQHGAIKEQLQDASYFQQYLLKVQLYFFKKGSDIYSVITQLRAEVNRSVQGIKRQYGYRAAQSVSYLKKRLKKLGIAAIEKTKVESKVRERLYVSINGGVKVEANRYCLKTKRTVLFCCDAINAKIQIHDTKKKTKVLYKAA